LNIFELSPETRKRLRQQQANSTLTLGEQVETLLIEALNARDAKEQYRGDVKTIARIMGCDL
jgi:hypothetical protein